MTVRTEKVVVRTEKPGCHSVRTVRTAQTDDIYIYNGTYNKLVNSGSDGSDALRGSTFV